MPGWDRKVRVAWDWAFDLILPRDIAQLHIHEPESVRRLFFHRGETIFREGDFGDRLFVIVKGEVEIVRNGNVLTSLKPGEIFGEMALASDEPRSASASAKTDVSVVAISRGAFQELVTHLPGVRTTVESIMQSRGYDISQLKHEPTASK